MAEYQLYQQPGQGQQGGPPPPKPPRQNPYHDGIQSSAQYYDLFEMIRRPNLSKDNRPPDPPARPAKTLTKQKRIEQEVEQKFRSRQSRKKNPNGSLLASFIRLLFLLFILPPYIILYRLPKLLLIDSVLYVARKVDNALAAVGKAIQDAYERFKARIRNAFISFWNLIKATFHKKMASQENDDEPLSFLAFLAVGLVALYRITIYPTIKISKKIWNLSKRTIAAIREIPLLIHRSIQDTIKRVRSLQERVIHTIKNRLFLFKEALLNRTTRPVSRWIDAKVEALIALYRRLQEKVKIMVKALLFTLRHPIQASKLALNAMKNQRNRLSNAITIWFKGKKEAVYRMWIRVKTWLEVKIKSPLQIEWNRFKAILNRWMAPFKSYYHKIAEAIHSYAKRVNEKLAAFISKRLEAPKRWLKSIETLLSTYYKRIMAHSIAFCVKLKESLYRRLEPIFNFTRAFLEPFLWAGREMWKEMLPLFTPFKRFYKYTKIRIEAFAYRVRYLIAWISVLTRYGMELVRGNTEKLFGNFSWR